MRTNSEAIVGATAEDDRTSYSGGVSITSSIYPDDHTHIEPVRYPKGSSMLGLLATKLVDGGPGLPRPVRFLVEVGRQVDIDQVIAVAPGSNQRVTIPVTTTEVQPGTYPPGQQNY